VFYRVKIINIKDLN